MTASEVGVRVVVDRNKCINSGMCTAIAPETFELDDAGNLVVLLPALDNAVLVEGVRDAAACCPAEAISLSAPRGNEVG